MASEPSNSPYRYWAFVSYASRDRKVARKLQRSLESYRVPADLVGRPGRDGEAVPESLFPIFRDRDELSLTSDIGASVQEALHASRFLIVICSPDAATSRWVDEEIRYFRSLGRDDRVLAIMVRGEPNASVRGRPSSNECFPLAMRLASSAETPLRAPSAEPLAGDLRPGGDGWTGCVLKAVAGITGLGLNAFVRRENQRRRRSQIGGAVGALMGIALLTAWWDHTRLKVAHFANLTERFGVPVGVGRLDPEVVRHRRTSYRLESRRGKVLRVLRLNGVGELQEDSQGLWTAVQEISYREDGTVRQIDHLNRSQQAVLHRLFSARIQDPKGPAVFIEWKDPREQAPLALPNRLRELIDTEDWNRVEAKSEITVYRVVYRADGLPSQETYHNAYHWPRASSDGPCGKAFRYDDLSLPTETVFLGASQQPTPSRGGTMIVRQTHDRQGNVLTLEFLDRHRQPVLGPELFAQGHYRYDRFGNQVEATFFDREGRPTCRRHGEARVTMTFDEHGHKTSEAHFDVSGLPVLCQHGNARLEERYDARGNSIETRFYGTRGEPVLTPDGHHRFESSWDARGRRVGEALFGLSNEPVLCADGYSAAAFEYDDSGKTTAARYTGTDGRPGLVGSDGVCAWTMKYDGRGRRTEGTLLGVDGKPAIGKDGWAKITWHYDDLDRLSEEAYFGVDDSPILSWSRLAAREKYEYNSQGLRNGMRQFGIDAKPVCGSDGIAGYQVQHDDRGNAVAVDYLGVDGRPMALLSGEARRTFSYDDWGRETERAFYGTNGFPVMIREGYTRWTATYDERGNEISRVYYDTHDAPVLLPDGYAMTRARYDDRGKMVAVSYLGTNGLPSVAKTGYAGWTAEYDERGNRLAITFLGADGKPILLAQGYARSASEYDNRNREVAQSFFGVEGQPVLSDEGFFRQTSTFDKRGNLIENCFLGTNGLPILHTNGLARSATRYDSAGRAIERRFFGLRGEPVELRLGYACWRAKYDARGNEVEKAYFGLRGQLVLTSDGYARVTYRYDEFGNRIEVCYYGPDDRPAAPSGWAREVVNYERSTRRKLSTLHYGVDGGVVSAD